MAASLVRKELEGEPPRSWDDLSYTFASAWGDIRVSENRVRERFKNIPWPFSVDQYRINMAPRHAASEALFGWNRGNGLFIGLRGFGLAFLSENPLLEYSNQEKIGLFNRAKIVGKDVVTSLGGLAVVALATQRPTRRRTAAVRIAKKLMK